MYKEITSLQNPLVKQAVLLKNKARERKAQGLFLAEGLRELKLALQNGLEASTLFFDPTVTDEREVEYLCEKAVARPGEIVQVSTPVFQKIAYRDSVPNVVGIFRQPQPDPVAALQNLRFQRPDPLILVFEGMEKPGNLGAILRTADAAGVDAVLVCDPQFDLYNPNAIRASLGAIFSLKVVDVDSTTAIQWLRSRKIPILATWLEAARPLYETDLTGPAALVLGAESQGISGSWLEAADHRIIIPMKGQVDSLNVSASAAIVLFEAVRQRLG